VHVDLCGPISPTSNNNKRYILSFVDDYSRKAWVYFLHEKSETFNSFRSFKACVENETGSFIACLRTNRDGEFMSKEFSYFCRQLGISRQLTAAYTPQQNGVAERKNRTMINSVRAVLHEKQIPKSFLPEAVKWCIHVQNRSPTTAINHGTPEEMWSGLKPRVDYFRLFGCIAHVHVPDQRRSKLDDKSHQCVLLGVSDEMKAYKLFDPITKKIIISKDMIFEEDKIWNWDEERVESTRTALNMNGHDEDESSQEEEENDNVEVTSQHGEESGNVELTPPHMAATYLQPSDSTNTLVQRRATRTRRQPSWLRDYETNLFVEEEEDLLAMLTDSADPLTFEEAKTSSKWREAMDTEIQAIERNNMWVLVDPPDGVIPIGVKWVFKTKLNEKGEIEKHKAKLVAKVTLRNMELTTQRFLLLLLGSIQ